MAFILKFAVNVLFFQDIAQFFPGIAPQVCPDGQLQQLVSRQGEAPGQEAAFQRGNVGGQSQQTLGQGFQIRICPVQGL